MKQFGLLSLLAEKYELRPARKNLRRILTSDVSQLVRWRTADLPESAATGPCQPPAPNRWKRTCGRCCISPIDSEPFWALKAYALFVGRVGQSAVKSARRLQPNSDFFMSGRSCRVFHPSSKSKLKSLRAVNINHSPKHGAIPLRAVSFKLRQRLCKASQHDDGVRSGCVTDGP